MSRKIITFKDVIASWRLPGESLRDFAIRLGMKSHQRLRNWLKGGTPDIGKVYELCEFLGTPEQQTRQLVVLAKATYAHNRKGVETIENVTTKGWDNFARRLLVLKGEKETQSAFLKRCEVTGEEWKEWVRSGAIVGRRLKLLVGCLGIQNRIWLDWLATGDSPPPDLNILLAHNSGGSSEESNCGV